MTQDQYKPASWRGTLPKDPETGEIKISFNLPDGQILRMKLDEENAKRFSESIHESLYPEFTEFMKNIIGLTGQRRISQEKTFE